MFSRNYMSCGMYVCLAPLSAILLLYHACRYTSRKKPTILQQVSDKLCNIIFYFAGIILVIVIYMYIKSNNHANTDLLERNETYCFCKVKVIGLFIVYRQSYEMFLEKSPIYLMTRDIISWMTKDRVWVKEKREKNAEPP
jgi:hypothetical protein